MERVENHMVALPQPELDCGPECAHNQDGCEWEHYNVASHTDVDVDGSNAHVTLTLNCIHCEREIQSDFSWRIEE